MTLANELSRVGRVLDNPVRVNQVKAVVGERQVLTVGHLKPAVQPLLVEVGTGQIDRRCGKVDACDLRAAFRETRQVDAGAAADLENRSAAVAVKVDERQQVMEFLEVIVIQIVEKAAGADRMPRDFQVVNMRVPVLTHVIGRRHRQNYIPDIYARRHLTSAMRHENTKTRSKPSSLFFVVSSRILQT